MVKGAMALLARRGMPGTSFTEVLRLTGAPRGSLYHHFPQGKDQLVAAALEQAGVVLADAMQGAAGAAAPVVVERFLGVWRVVLERSQCESGCAVLAVSVSGGSAELLARSRDVFRAWSARLAELLQRGGMSCEAARRFAVVLVAAVEGAVVLSRAERSLEPFDIVAAQLMQQLHALLAAEASRPARR